MSKLIVEMEMPKSCPCDLANGDTPCFAAHGIPKRWADFEKHSKLLYTRPWWCPIVGELPEQHGDLIDRDHFKENLDMVCDAGGWLEPVTQSVRVYCKKQVDSERAIVPATERSET